MNSGKFPPEFQKFPIIHAGNSAHYNPREFAVALLPSLLVQRFSKRLLFFILSKTLTFI